MANPTSDPNNHGEGIELTPEEQAAFVELRDRIVNDPNLAPSISEEMCVQGLMARKFEVDRAFDLLSNSVKWRKEQGIEMFLPLTQPILKELKTKKIIIPPTSRDKEGSQIVYYKPALARKHEVKPKDFCISIYYLLQKSIRDPVIQRKGFLFICDLRNTKLTQVDRKLVKSILDMLSNKFPARLKKVLLLEPPSFFNIAFRLIRPLIPAKYLEKVATAKIQDLLTYADSDKVLPDYGGTLAFDPISYLDQLYNEEQQQQVQPPTLPATTPTTNNVTPGKLDESKNISNPLNTEGVAAL